MVILFHSSASFANRATLHEDTTIFRESGSLATGEDPNPPYLCESGSMRIRARNKLFITCFRWSSVCGAEERESRRLRSAQHFLTTKFSFKNQLVTWWTVGPDRELDRKVTGTFWQILIRLCRREYKQVRLTSCWRDSLRRWIRLF